MTYSARKKQKQHKLSLNVFSWTLIANNKGDKNNFRPNNNFFPFENVERFFIKYASEKKSNASSIKLQLFIQVKEQSLFPLIELALEGNKWAQNWSPMVYYSYLPSLQLYYPPQKHSDQ